MSQDSRMVIVDETADVATPKGPMRVSVRRPSAAGRYPGLILFPEIFQETGPIGRMAALIAGHGFVVLVPEIYHEYLEPGTALAYDEAGSALGNELKYRKPLAAYDSDARAAFDHLAALDHCSGRLGAMGVCLGGHLALRAALQPDCAAAACFYATDVHSGTLGEGRHDDTLQRVPDARGELLMVWGLQDPHVPHEGRAAIHERFIEANVQFTWHELNGAHAFLRDEGARYDPELALSCYRLVVDLFRRRLCG
jgi:carboxymethylenebutenolidase